MKILDPASRGTINVTNTDVSQQVNDVFDAFEDINEKEPTLFSQNGRLVICEIVEGQNGEKLRQILTVGHAELRTWLVFHMDFLRLTGPQNQQVLSPTIPSPQLLDALMSAGEWRGVPELRDVSELPIVTQHGEVVQQRGYHAGTQIYLGPIEEYPIEDLPSDPPPHFVDRAKDLLLMDVLGDFQWKDDEEDRANALGAIMTAPTRFMYDCVLPMYLFDSTNPGSGKGTLASVIGQMWGGWILQPMPEDEDELRKRVIPALAATEKVIIFDNVEHEIGGPTLNALLTAPEFTDRVLGSSKQVTLPNNKLWCATGNNIRLGRDMGRRVVTVTQDPDKNPQERTPTDFRHPDLLGWMKAKERALRWATLILVNRWVADGMPKSSVALGNMTPWAETVGGILENVGVRGFLRNPLRNGGLDEDTLELYEFIEAITPYVGQNAFRARDLADMLNGALGPGPSMVILDSLPPKPRAVHQRNGAVHKSLGRYIEDMSGRFAGTTGVRLIKSPTWTPRDKTYMVERADWTAISAISTPTGI